MRDERVKYKTFTRRSVILSSVKGILISYLIGRFYYLQILTSNTYQKLSNRNRIRILPVESLRGNIFDLNGSLLAGSIKIYSLVMKAEFIKNLSSVVNKINDILVDQKISLVKVTENVKKEPRSQHIKLVKNISLQNAIIIESRDNLEEVQIIEEYIRNYFEKDSFHITGYVGAVTFKEIKYDNFSRKFPLLVGKDGIEKQYDKVLTGKPGLKKIEVDARGNFSREVDVVSSEPGTSITSYISSDVQRIISHHIRNYKGAIIIHDLYQRGIIGMISKPTVDPNLFITGLTNQEWKIIVNNKDRPLVNRCISKSYSPGSVFKIVMFLSVLYSGIDKDEKVYCPGYYILGNQIYRCHYRHGHGEVNLESAFIQSCNVYFYHQSLRVGINNIQIISHELGLGNKTGIDLPFEIDGNVPNMGWKRSKIKKNWYLGDTINVSIGQGYIETTPIQLLQMISRIATGKIFPLNVIKKTDSKIFKKLNINYFHLELLRKAMYATMNTNHILNNKNKNFAIAGKTGTSQVVSTTHRVFKNPYKDHSLFVGFVPYKEPRFSIATIIENGGWGAKTAMPIAIKILNELKIYFNS